MVDNPKLRRTLHLKFTLPSPDTAQLVALVKAAKPFYQLMGSKSVRLMQDVDDPKRCLQIIEYETHEAIELNRQKIASDPAFQTYLQSWRMMLGGAVDCEVYEDITGDAG
jgi:hypothetical protein